MNYLTMSVFVSNIVFSQLPVFYTGAVTEHNAMKLSWPQPFAEGDTEDWLEEFESIAACNGIKGDANITTALGTLLTGRARATFKAWQRRTQSRSFAELKQNLVAEFGTENEQQAAMENFNSMKYAGDEDVGVYFERLHRTIQRALPEATEATRSKLLRDRLIKSFEPERQEQLRLAAAVGDGDLKKLLSLARSLPAPVPISLARAEPSKLEDEVRKLANEVQQLRIEVQGTRTSARRTPARCFRCGGFGHFARDCKIKVSSPCSFFSYGSVPWIPIRINGKVEQAIVDSGAGVSLTTEVTGVVLKQCSARVTAVGGKQLTVKGRQKLEIEIAGSKVVHDMLVVEGVRETLVGVDLLRRCKAQIDFKSDRLVINGVAIPLNNSSKGRECARGLQSQRIPSYTQSGLQQCLSEFQHVFTSEGDPYGYCDWIPHKIELVPGKSGRVIQRRIPFKLVPEVRK